MPELPEVRTVVQFLNTLTGNRFLKIETHLESMFSNTLTKQLENQTIVSVSSHGKYIIFHLTDYDLISHLRMEGKYYYKDSYELTKHDHVVFTLDKGYLYYNDTRKFGTFDLRQGDTYSVPPLSRIAKEPFDITLDAFYHKIKKSRRAIKTLLLDQTIISGIGNIYADEILFLSKIKPMKQGNKITKKQAKTLIHQSINVLNDAIKLGGTTIHTFSSNDTVGWFQLKLYVHLRYNKPCKVCKTLIKKEKINGRTSYYCEHCQQ